MLTIQGIPKNPQPLQSNHCARSRMVPPDARRLWPNPLVERSKQLQAKRYVATTISMCACVLTSVSVFVIHMSYVYYVYLCITVDKGQSLAQYSNGLLQSLHLKEKAESTTPSGSIVSTETETRSPWLTGYQTRHKKNGFTCLSQHEDDFEFVWTQFSIPMATPFHLHCWKQCLSTFNENLPLASTSGCPFLDAVPTRGIEDAKVNQWEIWKELEHLRLRKFWTTKFSQNHQESKSIIYISDFRILKKDSPQENAVIGKTEGPHCATEGGTGS